jgi:SOS-response transcriptional repressor LexA
MPSFDPDPECEAKDSDDQTASLPVVRPGGSGAVAVGQAWVGLSLGEVIRECRERRGLTVAQLAEQTGCAKSYVSALENNLRASPSDEVLTRMEAALGLMEGELLHAGRWRRSMSAGGPSVQREVAQLEQTRDAAKRLARLVRGGSLDRAYESGELKRLVDEISPQDEPAQRTVVTQNAIATPRDRGVPLINKVAAGYPSEFTDLSYPARVADEYVRCPDVSDPDAFAARVVGDSMTPDYREGDVVVFSPARVLADGCDCFARLEPDHTSTFKRVFFEGDCIRLQALNPAYAPRVVERELVAGLYAAVMVIKKI